MPAAISRRVAQNPEAARSLPCNCRREFVFIQPEQARILAHEALGENAAGSLSNSSFSIASRNRAEIFSSPEIWSISRLRFSRSRRSVSPIVS